MTSGGKTSNIADMKKILIAVSGLSPQILTESLYALAVQRHLRPDLKGITTSKKRSICFLEIRKIVKPGATVDFWEPHRKNIRVFLREALMPCL